MPAAFGERVSPFGRLIRVDVVTMVAAALAAGAAAGAVGTAEHAVSDAYDVLKELIKRRYGVIEADVVAVENDPGEPLRRQLLARQLSRTGAGDDLDVRAAAEELLRVIAGRAPAAAHAAGVRLTRVEAGADIEISDIAGATGSALDASDIKAGGSIRITGIRVGSINADPTSPRG